MLPALLLGAVATGCGSAPPTGEAAKSASPGVVLTRVAGGRPARHEAAAVRAAFDEEQAAELIRPVPGEIDFATDALLCVYLGERSTGGWGLALQSATLGPDGLRILARETRPRGNVRPAASYPGDCATVPRSALPAGELAVRADDTISDELIVTGTIEVPPSAGRG